MMQWQEELVAWLEDADSKTEYRIVERNATGYKEPWYVGRADENRYFADGKRYFTGGHGFTLEEAWHRFKESQS